MNNIFSKFFFFLRYILIVIAFLLVLWGIMFTYQRLEKPLSEAINVLLPFLLVFIVFIVNLNKYTLAFINSYKITSKL